MKEIWKIVDLNGEQVVSTQGHGLAHVTMNSGNKAKAGKNLRLIAAVPDMVDLLERLIKWEKGGDEHDMDFILAEARAILNNIKGE